MKFAFVILHYLAEKDTIECIESILHNIKYDKKEVIIVDNASTNESFENIKKKYIDNKIVTFIKNKENLGFAKGNNIGYRYAKEVYKADFIVMINNDTIINQSDFCEVIKYKFGSTSFSVLGPDIITKDGYHQNPLKKRDWTVFKLRLFKIKALLRLVDAKTFRITNKILEKRRFIKERKNTLDGDFCDVRLHGSCLIFSPIYIRTFNGLDDGTFLYMEEDLLQMHMDEYGMKMMYTSDLKIYHKEDVSTNMNMISSKERDIKFLLNLINSINICIDRVKNKGGI